MRCRPALLGLVRSRASVGAPRGCLAYIVPHMNHTGRSPMRGLRARDSVPSLLPATHVTLFAQQSARVWAVGPWPVGTVPRAPSCRDVTRLHATRIARRGCIYTLLTPNGRNFIRYALISHLTSHSTDFNTSLELCACSNKKHRTSLSGFRNPARAWQGRRRSHRRTSGHGIRI